MDPQPDAPERCAGDLLAGRRVPGGELGDLMLELNGIGAEHDQAGPDVTVTATRPMPNRLMVVLIGRSSPAVWGWLAGCRAVSAVSCLLRFTGRTMPVTIRAKPGNGQQVAQGHQLPGVEATRRGREAPVRGMASLHARSCLEAVQV
jgi:hypothetical protein